jgi:thioredoxin reductase (NADPH)
MLSKVNMQVEDVIIIGAGPAGLAAAIQLKRYGIQPLLFERAALGGLLSNANLVENYPGFPRGVTGPGLVKLFARQAHNMDVVLTHEDVTTITYDQDLFGEHRRIVIVHGWQSSHWDQACAYIN